MVKEKKECQKHNFTFLLIYSILDSRKIKPCTRDMKGECTRGSLIKWKNRSFESTRAKITSSIHRYIARPRLNIHKTPNNLLRTPERNKNETAASRRAERKTNIFHDQNNPRALGFNGLVIRTLCAPKNANLER